MKKTRKLIPAFAMLLIATLMMSVASYAWFSMSTTVTATGMSVKAQASGSLLISNEYNGTYGASVAFTEDDIVLQPATYVENLTTLKDATGAALTGTNSYVYVTNTNAVDQTTGLGNDLRYAIVNNTTGDPDYYKDYTVYICGDTALDAGTVTASVTFATATGSQQATRVDFIVNSSAATAVTPEATGITVTDSVIAAEGTNQTAALGTLAIPAKDATSATRLAITMRVYIDGAATSTEGTEAYANTEDLNTTALGFDVSFIYAAPTA